VRLVKEVGSQNAFMMQN